MRGLKTKKFITIYQELLPLPVMKKSTKSWPLRLITNAKYLGMNI